MKKLLATAALITLVTSFGNLAHAQTAIPTSSAPGVVAPNGVNEIDQRLQNQNQRINNGVNDGQLNATQAQHDDNRAAHVSQELSKDQAKDGDNGAITKRQQAKLNRQLNKNSHRLHHQRVKGSKAVTPAPVSTP